MASMFRPMAITGDELWVSQYCLRHLVSWNQESNSRVQDNHSKKQLYNINTVHNSSRNICNLLNDINAILISVFSLTLWNQIPFISLYNLCLKYIICISFHANPKIVSASDDPT